MSEPIRIAAVADIPPGTGRELMAGSRIVALYNVDGQFHAMDGLCPHAGGPLGNGRLVGSVVTCPWHGWQFDVTTGRHCLNPSLTHATYPVTVHNGELYVELP